VEPRKNNKYSSNRNVATHEYNDDSLNVSSIQKSEKSAKPGWDAKDPHYLKHRESAVSSIVSPLLNPALRSVNERKSYCGSLATTEGNGEGRSMKYSKYNQSNKPKERYKKKVHTFKDLFQYENFQDDLNLGIEPVAKKPKEQSPVPMKQRRRYSHEFLK